MRLTGKSEDSQTSHFARSITVYTFLLPGTGHTLPFKADKLLLKLVATDLNALFPLNLILVTDNK
jgi:hypothetical protein